MPILFVKYTFHFLDRLFMAMQRPSVANIDYQIVFCLLYDFMEFIISYSFSYLI